MIHSVLHCGDDVLDQECDMPTVHHHLTNLPQTIDFASNLQKIMDSASLLFRKHPPSYLAGKNKSYERCSILSGTVSRIFLKHPTRDWSFLDGPRPWDVGRRSIFWNELSEFRDLEPSTRLIAPKILISDSYKKIATLSMVGIGLYWLITVYTSNLS